MKSIKVGKFNIRIVPTGGTYGRNNCLINEGAPMVEFYDSRYDQSDWSGLGQFVSRYLITTLLEDSSGGLILYGGEPEWVVSESDMQTVRAYINGNHEEVAV